MSLELEKSMRIINDVVSFCYYEGADEFAISLKRLPTEAFEMRISCTIPDLSNETLTLIRQNISLPRQHEIEQQYWELSGETEFSGEMSLAGAMSDEAEVRYEDGELSIRIMRKDQ